MWKSFWHALMGQQQQPPPHEPVDTPIAAAAAAAAAPPQQQTAGESTGSPPARSRRQAAANAQQRQTAANAQQAQAIQQQVSTTREAGGTAATLVDTTCTTTTTRASRRRHHRHPAATTKRARLAPTAPPDLVWVKDGKQDYQAYLLPPGDDDVPAGYTKIKWFIAEYEETVLTTNIRFKLEPRRRRQSKPCFDDGTPVAAGTDPTNPSTSRSKKRRSPAKQSPSAGTKEGDQKPRAKKRRKPSQSPGDDDTPDEPRGRGNEKDKDDEPKDATTGSQQTNNKNVSTPFGNYCPVVALLFIPSTTCSRKGGPIIIIQPAQKQQPYWWASDTYENGGGVARFQHYLCQHQVAAPVFLDPQPTVLATSLAAPTIWSSISLAVVATNHPVHRFEPTSPSSPITPCATTTTSSSMTREAVSNHDEKKDNDHQPDQQDVMVPVVDSPSDRGDIQFLYTVPAPTMMERTTTTTTTPNGIQDDKTADAVYEPPQTAVEIIHLDSDDDDDQKPAARILATSTTTTKAAAIENGKQQRSSTSETNGDDSSQQPSKTTTTTTSADKDGDDDHEGETTPLEYSCISSAYVQNLAEICYTILMDERWRLAATGGSAGAAPFSQPLFCWELGDDMGAVALLSRYYRPLFQKNQKDESSSSCHCLLCWDTKSNVGFRVGGGGHGDDETKKPASGPEHVGDDDDDDDDESARALYLYCRLFYRKGPWFRLDDLYKYYSPPKRKAPGPVLEEVKGTTDGTTDGPLIDNELLESHKECLRGLLVDLFQLKSNGLIREFAGEEECGKTIGKSVLRSDERNAILSKIGAKKKAARRLNSNTSSSASSYNDIWKQMSQQKSLHSLFGDDSSRSNLLPVKKHVDDLLIDKLAQLVVQSCSRADYVPAKVMRIYSSEVKDYLRETIAKDFPSRTLLGTCFRLREAPLRTLQRCSRLYLCATGGPGDMRGDGSNGWRSLNDLISQADPPLAKLIPPPSAATWHKVDYPGLMFRFGRASAPFANAYESVPAAKELSNISCDREAIKVFYSQQSFWAWEMAVELRANVDYLIELHEWQRSEQRRRERGVSRTVAPRNSASGSVDFMKMLESEGQEAFLCTFYAAIGGEPATRTKIPQQLKLDLKECLSNFNSVCEKVLGSIGVMILHILCDRHQNVSSSELDVITKRPWLRHLIWDGCLAYILWDVIPYFERNGTYRLAVQSLQVLLFGRIDSHLEAPTVLPSTALTPLLLSRRARGKALDRLVIDSKHMYLKAQKEKTLPEEKQLVASYTVEFCKQVIGATATSGTISFSAIRGLARRLKRPLKTTLDGFYCTESRELGLRLANDELVSMESPESRTYSDWIPPTDRTVANAIANDNETAGGRCAFVGFEEGEVESRALKPSSLNVEELAMEYYRTGRLPEDSSSVKGGWHGWHDEGGHLRALFRILSSAAVLGMDWGCTYDSLGKNATESHRTIHLSPYQTAPFDLHVGYELHNGQDERNPVELLVPSNSFYFRRQDKIGRFLNRLERLSGQQLCDLVYQSMSDRLEWMRSQSRKDPNIERDLMQTRSLSAVAAGCGGKQLAAAFRCMFYDYRHYSGGLPDLLLVRALYDGDNSYDTSASQFTDLGDWIGESFSPEYQQQLALERGVSMLSDRDDEFLGCSKIGDSGGRTSSRTSRHRLVKPPPSNSDSTTQAQSPPFNSSMTMPERLVLVHNGRPVRVECMWVEVKSSNDRLDPRQEDWLNILDRNGNARVCKFEGSGTRAGKRLLAK